jgi:aliphatic sulfonates family ABC transporter substrate-binding protein
MTRLSASLAGLAFFLLLAAGNAPALAADSPRQLRIGYQKSGAFLVVKQQALLERRLPGMTVQWVEFPSGPPMLEALNAGSLDFGTVGDTPPIYAQAAGVDFVYVGFKESPGDDQAILVRTDAGIAALGDLKGKRIGFTKGSSAHYLVVRALARAGIAYKDIQPVYLSPPDAAAAFQRGSIAAWAIWDPFFALAERDPAARVLVTSNGIAPRNSFFLARREYAADHPDIVTAVIGEIERGGAWAEQNQEALASLLAAATGVEIGAQRVAAARGTYGARFMTDAVVQEQQAVADAFFALGLVPKHVDVRAAVWAPAS